MNSLFLICERQPVCIAGNSTYIKITWCVRSWVFVWISITSWHFWHSDDFAFVCTLHTTFLTKSVWTVSELNSFEHVVTKIASLVSEKVLKSSYKSSQPHTQFYNFIHSDNIHPQLTKVTVWKLMHIMSKKYSQGL